MIPDGYAKHHPVGITVRADTLETVYGYDDAKFEMELSFAEGMLDTDCPDNMRWLAALMARRIEEIEAREASEDES